MRWIVFDYGNVISRATEALPVLAGLLGMSEETFNDRYWAARHEYDLGLSDMDYWRAVGGDSVDAALAAELTEVDEAGWLHADPSTVRLLADLDEAGVPLALLSNAPTSFARRAEREPWTKHFRHLVFSGDLGVAKPDERIWAELAARIGARLSDCLFFDDRQDNIDGALAAGMKALLWQDSARARLELRAELGEFGP